METTDRSEQMRRLLERREREKLTFRQAAALEPGVSVHMLFWWRRKLFGRRAPAPRRRKGTGAFIELVAPKASPPRTSRYELVLCGSRRIVVDGSFEERTLARLIALLESRC